MKNSAWQEFNFRQNYQELNNKIEVKISNGKIISIWRLVGGNVLDNRGEKIDTDDILFFRRKKDLERYSKLQKYHQELVKYDFDTLNDFEWCVLNGFERGSEEYGKIEKLFKKLLKYIEKAQENIITESKTFLDGRN